MLIVGEHNPPQMFDHICLRCLLIELEVRTEDPNIWLTTDSKVSNESMTLLTSLNRFVFFPHIVN